MFHFKENDPVSWECSSVPAPDSVMFLSLSPFKHPPSATLQPFASDAQVVQDDALK